RPPSSANPKATDRNVAIRRLRCQRTSISTRGASRNVHRMASAKGMNTSCASFRTTTTITVVKSATRVAPGTWTRPFIPKAPAGFVPRGRRGSRARAGRTSLPGYLRRKSQLELLQALDLIPQSRRLLELEVARALEHLRLQLLDLPHEHLGPQIRRRGRLLPRSPAPSRCWYRGARAFHDIRHRLLNTARNDPVLGVVLELPPPPPVGLLQSALHRAGYLVGVQNGLAVDVTCRATDRLDERVVRSQESFLVSIEDRDQRYLRHIQSLAQEVDSNQHVKLAEAQIT